MGFKMTKIKNFENKALVNPKLVKPERQKSSNISLGDEKAVPIDVKLLQ